MKTSNDKWLFKFVYFSFNIPKWSKDFHSHSLLHCVSHSFFCLWITFIRIEFLMFFCLSLPLTRKLKSGVKQSVAKVCVCIHISLFFGSFTFLSDVYFILFIILFIHYNSCFFFSFIFYSLFLSFIIYLSQKWILAEIFL